MHISCHHKNTIGGQEKIKQTNKHEQCLGLTQVQKESMQHYMHVRTNASVGYERKFHKQLECRHLDSVFFAGPYLLWYCLRRRPHLSVVLRQLFCWVASLLSRRQLLSPGSRRQLPISSFLQPTLFRVSLPLPDTARFQVPKSFVWFRAKPDKESSAWRATHIVLQILPVE